MKKIDYRKVTVRGISFIAGSDGTVDGVKFFGKNSSGYMTTSRMVNRKTVTLLIHRIIAAAFLEAPAFPDFVVDHIDGDKLNNAASNLRWVSKEENLHNVNNRNVVRIIIFDCEEGKAHAFYGYSKAQDFLNCTASVLWRYDITGRKYRGRYLINIKRKRDEA